MKKVYPKEGTRVRIPGTYCIRTQYEVVGRYRGNGWWDWE